MWRQSANWAWPFWPGSGGRCLWLCAIVGGCLLGAITAFAGDKSNRSVLAPDFAVIEIAVRPGKQRTPISFLVQLAETEAQQRHGLMFTPYLPKHQGMLFVFETDAPRQFWMKNTQIPLDMLFFASDGRLVNIVHSAVPFSLTSRNSSGPARYVLELNGGIAAEIGVQPDAQLMLPLPGQ
jgi:uncharacterized membrane protein (UPF0127 family)